MLNSLAFKLPNNHKKKHILTTIVLLPIAITIGFFVTNNSVDQSRADPPTSGSSISISSLGSVAISSNASGAIAATKDTVTVSTTLSAGYQLYINTVSSDTALNHLSLPSESISSINGSINAPAQLQANTWGFASPGVAGFDSTYNQASPANNSKWAEVPMFGDDSALLKTTTTPASNEQTDVYFAAKVTASQVAGQYAQTIVYTAIGDGTSIEVAQVSPNSGPTAGGTPITITGAGFTGATAVTLTGTGGGSLVTDQSYDTCGTPQAFTAPSAGEYALEAWGAGAGKAAAGRGGYTTGKVSLNSGETIYVYVGCQGVAAQANYPFAYVFNGGAYVHNSTSTSDSGGGGGATDFRLVNGDWDNLASLQSRILVAGGGGGGYSANTALQSGNLNLATNGGQNGTYTGCSGAGQQGSFGKGGAYDSSDDAGGGAGGWYGGCSTGDSAGSGGSPYVFTSSSDKTGYSGNVPNAAFYLTDTQIVTGAQSMPNPAGGANITGWQGVGYARISHEQPSIVNCTNITVVSDAEITCTTPAGSPGAAIVNVTTPEGESNSSVAFTYLAPPTIDTVSPSSGSTAGGTAITITGANFSTATGVTIDGNACTSFNVVSNTQITCATPAGAAGARDVVVLSPLGNATKTGGYTYTAPPPTVTAISPNSGHYLGGETVTITGTGFTGATTVKVGGNACRSNVVNSDTQIKCVVAGATDTDSTTSATTIISNSFMTSATSPNRSVAVTTSAGTSAANTLWTYRYANSSFTTQGTYLHILGTDIVNGSIATVGGGNLGTQQIVDSTHMTGVSPAQTAGAKTVAISNTVTSQGNMQNFNCAAIPTPAYTVTDWAPYTRVLTDTRDGKMYRIRKLPDGHCWMIDNLKLGGTGSDITLTSADTNIGTNPGGQTSFVLPANPINNAATKLSNGRCDAASLTNTSGTYLTCTGASPTAPATTTAKTDQSDDDLRFAGYVDPADALNTTMSQNCRPGAPFINSASLSACGYLYNWYTATAGIGNYTWPADTTTNANATTSDICPAGWHLPKSGTGSTTGNEFATLNGAMIGGSAATTNSAATRTKWRSAGPFEGSYSGGWTNGFGDQGYYGYYWSASASSATSARYLNFSYSLVNLGSSNFNKYHGYAVRCML